MQKTFIEFNKTTDEAVNEFEKEILSQGSRILGTVHDWQYVRYDSDGNTKFDHIHKTVVCYTDTPSQGDRSSEGKKTGFNKNPDELGGAWYDKYSEDHLSCQLHDGKKFKILINSMRKGKVEGEWIHETPKEKMWLRENKSDNPKAPKYRIFSKGSEQP